MPSQIGDYNIILNKYQRGLISQADFENYNYTTFRPYLFGGAVNQILPDVLNIKEDFNNIIWTEDDNSGRYEPGWTDPITDEYHPPSWTGHIDISTSGDVVNVHDNEFFRTMLYKDMGPGHYRDFVHDFILTTGAPVDNNPFATSYLYRTGIWGLANKVLPGHTLQANYHYLDGEIIPFADIHHADSIGLEFSSRFHGGDGGYNHILWVRTPTTRFGSPSWNFIDYVGADYVRSSGARDINGESVHYDIHPSSADGSIPHDRNRPDKHIWVRIERHGSKIVFLFHRKIHVVHYLRYSGASLFPSIAPYWSVGPAPHPNHSNVAWEWTDETRTTGRVGGSKWWLFQVVSCELSPYFDPNMSWRYLYVNNSDLGAVSRNRSDYSDDLAYYHSFSPYTIDTWENRYGNIQIEDLYTFDNFINGYPTLFIQCAEVPIDQIDLVTVGHLANNDNITLHIVAPTPVNDNVTLYVGGSNYDMLTDQLTLYSEAGKEDNISLFVCNKDVLSWLSLYIFGIPNPQNENITSFIYDGADLEDFTTYTLVDVSGYHTNKYSYNRIDTSLIADDDAWFYSDKKAGFFRDQFELYFEFELKDFNNAQANLISFSNVVTSPSGWSAGNDEAVAVRVINKSGDNYVVQVQSYENGQTSSSILLEENKHYYATLKRDYVDVGGGTYYDCMTLEVYNDSGRSNLVDSEYVIINKPSRQYRYLGVAAVIDEADGNKTIDFMIENIRMSHVFQSEATTLHIHGHTTTDQYASLYVVGYGESANTYVPLSVYGGGGGLTFGLFSNVPLFICDTQTSAHGISLYLKNTQSEIPYPGHAIYLFIGGMGDVCTSSISLYICQEAIYSNFTLYVKAPGKILNAVQATDDVPFYIYRPNETAVMPLVIYNDIVAINSYITLFVGGGISVTDNITLVLPEVAVGETSNIPLVCSSGGSINTYTTLYIDGVYDDSNYMTLVMLESTDQSVGSVNLYVNGY